MRKLFFTLSLFLFSLSAESQLQLANPINVKQFNNKRLKKKARRKKAIIEEYIPFDLKGGLIFLTANMSGQQDSFVLDTGAPSLLLNRKVPIDSSDTVATDITGSVPMQNVIIPKFIIGNITTERVNAYFLDLSHIQANKQHKVAGMIGYEQIKGHELFLDYQRRQMLLLDTERGIYPEAIEPSGYIPFTMQKHFIVVVVKIGGKKLKFGIDTGAEVNLLSKKTYEKLAAHFKFEKEDSIRIRGVKEKALNSQQVIIEQTIIRRKNYANMPYVVMDMERMNNIYEIKLDGILGYPFLASQKFSINYADKMMYIWKDVLPERKVDEADVLASDNSGN